MDTFFARLFASLFCADRKVKEPSPSGRDERVGR